MMNRPVILSFISVAIAMFALMASEGKVFKFLLSIFFHYIVRNRSYLNAILPLINNNLLLLLLLLLLSLLLLLLLLLLSSSLSQTFKRLF